MMIINNLNARVMKVIKIVTTSLLVALSFNLRAEVINATHENYLKMSRETAQNFSQTLGKTLKAQIESGGVESAIAVCKEVAPALAKQYSDHNRTVTRVSLKPRNQTIGIPNAWEKEVLNHFDEQAIQKADLTQLETTKVVESNDGKWFYYMKAIPTQSMCLQCHGQSNDIPTSVKALLSKEYPLDQGIGYVAGQVRGAISIKYRIKEN
jgi:hypothetical protein